MRSADWLAERFGLSATAQLAGPVDRGYQGQVWRLTCGDRAYAVKEALTPLDHDQVVAAYALQARAQAAGILAPTQFLTVDGEPAAYVDGETLRLFDWVDLAAPDRWLDPVAVGRMLAALHKASAHETSDLSDLCVAMATHRSDKSGVVDSWYVDPVGRDRWVELIAELRLAGAPFAEDLAALLPDLVASESCFTMPTDVIICHRDLWADNVRDSPRGPTVIDWDNCGPASTVGELAMLVVEFGATPERARALHEAYRRAGGPAEITRLGDFTMPLAVLQHLVELGATQWLAAAGDLARQRAEARVREFTDDPFGTRQAAELLGALR